MRILKTNCEVSLWLRGGTSRHSTVQVQSRIVEKHCHIRSHVDRVLSLNFQPTVVEFSAKVGSGSERRNKAPNIAPSRARRENQRWYENMDDVRGYR